MSLGMAFLPSHQRVVSTARSLGTALFSEYTRCLQQSTMVEMEKAICCTGKYIVSVLFVCIQCIHLSHVGVSFSFPLTGNARIPTGAGAVGNAGAGAGDTLVVVMVVLLLLVLLLVVVLLLMTLVVVLLAAGVPPLPASLRGANLPSLNL